VAIQLENTGGRVRIICPWINQIKHIKAWGIGHYKFVKIAAAKDKINIMG